VLNHLQDHPWSSSSLELSVLKMIFGELRSKMWAMREDEVVTEAVLRFSVHVYRESQLMRVSDNKHVDSAELEDCVEREFIFSVAHKLGVASVRVFSDSWEQFLTCQQLQQLIVMLAPTDDKDQAERLTSPLAPELIEIIEAYYSSWLFHGEDSCLLLTKYFKSTDVVYGRIVDIILKNAAHYHCEALFRLAQLQAANRQESGREVMDQDVFDIVTKAFDNLSKTSSPGKMVDYIDWLFTMCTSSHSDPAQCPFYSRMINLVCRPDTHQQILLHVLQRMTSHKLLMNHSSANRLGHALIQRYREHFPKRFGECGHTAYVVVIAEMHRARLECRHFVDNGEVVFDSEVVDVVRRSHSTKKKLMKLLSVDFPERSNPPRPGSS